MCTELGTYYLVVLGNWLLVRSSDIRYFNPVTYLRMLRAIRSVGDGMGVLAVEFGDLCYVGG